MRPLCALRNLVRLGCSMIGYLSGGGRLALAARALAFLAFGAALVLRHRIVFEDLALENPHLDAVGAIGGHGGRGAIVDICAQRVERHPAFAVPFGAGNLSTAEPAGAGDLDAFRSHALRRLDGDLHVFMKELAVFAPAGVPARIPGSVDTKPQADRIDFLTHQAASSSSRTTIVSWLKNFSIRPTRPRARGVQRFITRFLPTWASA